MPYTLGVDLGTSGAKAALMDTRRFALTSLAMREYDNAAQQPSAMLWNAVSEAIREAVAGVDPRQIRGIGLSAQMHGAVLYDARGAVIEPIINWQDKRCDAPLAKYNGRATIDEATRRLAGLDLTDLGVDKLASGYLGMTLFYLMENEPALFERVRHAVFPGDFIRGQLLGHPDYATDPTNAFGAGIFNARLGAWHDEVVQRLGLSRSVLPAVHPSTQVAGAVPPGVARALGLADGTPVVFGGGDNPVSLLGNGLVSQDSPTLINIGTAAQISQVAARYAKWPGLDTRNFFEGQFAFVGPSFGGGHNFAALRLALQKREGRPISYAEMNEAASRVAPGADGLIYHIATRRQPNRPHGFEGRLELTDIGHQSRAVMEGVLMDLRHMRPASGAGGAGFLAGSGKGLQNSAVWAQMAADMFGQPIKITNFENAVWGAAVLAGLGVGLIQNLQEAAAAIVYEKEFAPNPAVVEQYLFRG